MPGCMMVAGGPGKGLGSMMVTQGRIQGGGGPGGQDPPFWGTPKLHKEGKNGARMRAKTPHFST